MFSWNRARAFRRLGSGDAGSAAVDAGDESCKRKKPLSQQHLHQLEMISKVCRYSTEMGCK